MYNRYVRDKSGYTRVPSDDHEIPQRPHPSQREKAPVPPPAPPPAKPRREERPAEIGFFNGVLEKLHLGDLDSGDLLLLVLLFFLMKKDADEELIIALGLLLIL